MPTFPVSAEIGRLIFSIRGYRVMLDRDLAILYGTDTRALNRAVRRNLRRFPASFMFQLSWAKYKNLIYQLNTSNPSHNKHRKTPLIFTKHKIIMLASVLHSDHAIQVNVAVVEAFVRLRNLAENHRDLTRKLAELEGKYDLQFKAVFDAIRELMAIRSVPRKKITGLRNSD
jgi:hypothetical protein